MTPVEAVARAWEAMWRSGLDRTVSHRCCILAARVSTNVLGRLDVDARAVAFDWALFNEPARQLAAAGVPFDQWPEFAWSVYAGQEAPGNGYPGHVVTVTDDALVDLSAAQFHRPGRIELDGPLIIANPDRLPWPQRGEHIEWRMGNLTVMARATGDKGFRVAPDWADVSNWGRLADTVFMVARRLLDEDDET